MPEAWAGKTQWRILDTAFGDGRNFLAAWQAWKHDAQRPRLLHYISAEPHPIAVAELLRTTRGNPGLESLGQDLAAQWFGLVPGAHRLVFEAGHVTLTLHVTEVNDMLRRESFVADSVLVGTQLEAQTLKALARHCRRGTNITAAPAAGDIAAELARHGFTAGEFAPAWEPKGIPRPDAVVAGRCIVIGGGLAGAAAASSLALRGWQVTVLDVADHPASGASGVPVAMLAPHFSPDDNMLSRLSRAGVRLTLQQARRLLSEGVDFQANGVLERREAEPNESGEAHAAWSRGATVDELGRASLAIAEPALWHEQAGWIKPGALVRAWLAQAGIEWRGNSRTAQLARDGTDWVACDDRGQELGRAPLVVVAAALDSARLAGAELPLLPVRGQVSWAEQPAASGLPPFSINGNGHFIPGAPSGDGTAWFCGSTFDRGDTALEVREQDHASNLARLRQLLPAAATAVEHAFVDGTVRAWTGVRCASSNRRPLVGELQPGLWLSTAMGSRGLTFSVLCAELLAARLHAEPLPIEQRLAHALAPRKPAEAVAAR